MRLEQARLLIGRMKKFSDAPSAEELAKKGASYAERRRIEAYRKEFEEKHAQDNEAIVAAEKSLTVMAEMIHLFWYNGRVVDVQKVWNANEVVDTIIAMLENYELIPDEVIKELERVKATPDASHR